MPIGQIVNKQQLAGILGISGRMVSFHIDAGMPCKGSGKRGDSYKIDTAIAIKWLISEALLKETGGMSGGPEGSKQLHELRLKAAQADVKELEAAEGRGELIHVDKVEALLMKLGSAFVNGMNALAGRVAVPIAAVKTPGAARQIIRKECMNVRNECARSVGGYSSAFTDQPIETDSSATEPDT